MQSIGHGFHAIDLHFLGVEQVIAALVLAGDDGLAIVDPGPSTTLDVLRTALHRAGYAIRAIRAVLLTHIHLDHAGVTGTLVREHSGIRVFVHERGARHLIDPSRLLDSATRLYGADNMARLWGAIEPVPAANVETLAGGESIDVCGRTFDVAYTPGHASHHVAFFDRESRLAAVGDVGGGRLGGATFVMPPTPPPDIDLAAWQASIARIAAWMPSALFLTHFGLSPLDPVAHLAQLADRLPRVASYARDAMTRTASDAERVSLFQAELRRELREHVTEEEARAYELAMPFDYGFHGLQRYWQKQSA